MKKYLFPIAISLLIASCSGSPKNINKRAVTVSIEPLRYFTEQIAGDKFSVTTMVPKGSNPETYEPTAKQMMGLTRSDLYIKVGNIGFERTWMKKFTDSAPHIIVVNASEGINEVKTKQGMTDPHTWTSPANAKKICRNIYRSLRDLDVKDSMYYYKRLLEMNKKIDAVDFIIRTNLKHSVNHCFLIYHPSLTYFANEYKLQQIPIEEEGKEPSASRLQSLIKSARKANIKVMFVQKEFSTRNTEVISTSANVETKEINPLNYDWCKEMTDISNKLK
jgi:zinc transport system substrate-binding protein